MNFNIGYVIPEVLLELWPNVSKWFLLTNRLLYYNCHYHRDPNPSRSITSLEPLFKIKFKKVTRLQNYRLQTCHVCIHGQVDSFPSNLQQMSCFHFFKYNICFTLTVPVLPIYKVGKLEQLFRSNKF
jgi:hypothetical protein